MAIISDYIGVVLPLLIEALVVFLFLLFIFGYAKWTRGFFWATLSRCSDIRFIISESILDLAFVFHDILTNATMDIIISGIDVVKIVTTKVESMYIGPSNDKCRNTSAHLFAG